MSITNLEPIPICVFAVAGLVTAFAELLLGRIRRIRASVWSLVLAAVLSLIGGCLLAAGESSWFWKPFLALAVVELALAGIRLPMVGKLAGTPALHSGVLLAGCAALLGGQLFLMDRELEAGFAKTEAVLLDSLPPVELDGPPSLTVPTDGGRSVPLFSISSLQAISEAQESEHLRLFQTGNKAIQTSTADPTTNCHGWVFTGGRHWLRGQSVEAILEDNGYTETTEPEAGDVVVYRNSQGEVTHSGIVRGNADGLILIESKWGRLGRFIHTPVAHPYRTHVPTYYSSERTSHVLTGLEDE